MKILGIIPARYASTRFPGKALADIHGKPMVVKVYEQCLKASLLHEVVIATDDERIVRKAKEFGAKVILTGSEHQSGTDRCAEVAANNQFSDINYVINIQGDEPFIAPEQIDQLCRSLTGATQIATLIKKIEEEEVLFDEHVPKVIMDKHQNAIYFSRQTIPFVRNEEKSNWLKEHTFFKHIGMYAYRRDILLEICKLEQTGLEITESLEQLRWLENGFQIKTVKTEFDSFGIDTPEDLQKAISNEKR